MNRSDKRELDEFNMESHGRPGANKRLRDGEDRSGGPRRDRRNASGPYGAVAHSNLNERRQSGGKGSKPTGGLVIQSRGSQGRKISIAHAAFPNSSVGGNKGGTLSNSTNPTMPSTSGLSAESDSAMSGTYSLSRFLTEAPIPESPEPKEVGPTETTPRSHSRSSLDPIDLIDSDVKPNDATHPISIEDDSADDITEGPPEEPPEVRSRPPPSTPKKQTPLRAGHVRDARAKFDQPQGPTQASISAWLTPTPSTQPSAVPRAGPSSRGNPIVGGFTRQTGFDVQVRLPQKALGGVASHMAGKSRKNTRPNALSKPLANPTVGPESRSAPDPPPSRPKQGRKQSPLVLRIQEWYCGNKYHAAVSDDPYSFKLEGTTILLSRKGSGFTIIKPDLEGIEVAESSNDENTSEFIPALIFTLKHKACSTLQWQQYGGGDDDPRVLVQFDPQPEGFDASWQELTDSVSKLAQTRIVKIFAMKAVIQDMANRSSSAIPTKRREPSLVKPLVQDQGTPPKQDTPNNDPKTRVSPVPATRRTRSMALNPKNEEDEPQPLPIEDPDKVMLVYPQAGAGAVTINRGELARLEPGEFLNDTLIELGLKMWLNGLREQDPALAEEIHVFSSFFFKKLDGGRGKGCQYDKVKKWTAKFDLFSKKFIIVPINEHLHWYLAIICFPEYALQAPPPHLSSQPTRVTRSSDAAAAIRTEQPRMSSESDMPNTDRDMPIDVEAGSPTEAGRMEIDSELADQSQRMAIDVTTPPETPPEAMNVDAGPGHHDSEPVVLDMTNDGEDNPPSQPTNDDEKPKKTWILILDSLGGRHPRTVRLLREYLQSEAQERRKAVVELKDLRSSGGLVEDRHLMAPVQPNWCDCGVYLLHYVEVFYSNPLKILALPSGARRKGSAHSEQYEELWRTEQVKQKREEFRDKVNGLSSVWLQSKESAPKNDAEKSLVSVAPTFSPLPALEGDTSVQLIDIPASPKAPETIPNSPSSLTSRPTRDGLLPSVAPEGSEDEVEIMTTQSPEGSGGSKATRRGGKGGRKHGPWPGSSEGAQPSSSPDL